MHQFSMVILFAGLVGSNCRWGKRTKASICINQHDAWPMLVCVGQVMQDLLPPRACGKDIRQAWNMSNNGNQFQAINGDAYDQTTCWLMQHSKMRVSNMKLHRVDLKVLRNPQLNASMSLGRGRNRNDVEMLCRMMSSQLWTCFLNSNKMNSLLMERTHQCFVPCWDISSWSSLIRVERENIRSCSTQCEGSSLAGHRRIIFLYFRKKVRWRIKCRSTGVRKWKVEESILNARIANCTLSWFLPKPEPWNNIVKGFKLLLTKTSKRKPRNPIM